MEYRYCWQWLIHSLEPNFLIQRILASSEAIKYNPTATRPKQNVRYLNVKPPSCFLLLYSPYLMKIINPPTIRIMPIQRLNNFISEDFLRNYCQWIVYVYLRRLRLS